MNIYLDVDGTIIDKKGKIIENLSEFLIYAFSKGDVYWLTTHCKEGNNEAVLRHIEPFVTSEQMDLLKKIKPLKWKTLKTEAIDFTQPFLWFDDYLLEVEKNILKEKGFFNCWVKPDKILLFDLNKLI